MIIVKFWKNLNHSGTIAVGVIGLIVILVATAGVITRFVLKVSIAWSDELLRTIFLWGYFVGVALCYEEGGIMRLELLEDSLKKRGYDKALNILKVVCASINSAFFAVSTYFVYVICMQHFARGTTSGTSSTPAWVLPASYGIGCILITILAARDLIRAVCAFCGKHDAASEE